MLPGISSFFVQALSSIHAALKIVNEDFGNLILTAVTGVAALYALRTVREAVRARTVGGHPHLVLQAAEDQDAAFTIGVDLTEPGHGQTREVARFLELVNHGTGPALNFSLEMFGRLTHFTAHGDRWKWLLERNLLADQLETVAHGATPSDFCCGTSRNCWRPPMGTRH